MSDLMFVVRTRRERRVRRCFERRYPVLASAVRLAVKVGVWSGLIERPQTRIGGLL